MVKYFLKVSFTLLFLTLLKNIVFAEVKLISPYNGEVLEDRVVNFKWENTDRDTEYVYQHVIYINGKLDDTSLAIEVGSEEEYTWGYVDNRLYFWEIRYEPKESFKGYYNHRSDIFVFGLNREVPDSAWDLLEEYNKTEEVSEEIETPKEETPKEEPEQKLSEQKPVEEEKVLEEKEEVPLIDEKKQMGAILTREIRPTITEQPQIQEEDYNWNFKNSSLLGTSENNSEEDGDILCRFKYYKSKKSFEKVFCKDSTLEFTKQEIYPFSDEYSLDIEGTVDKEISIQVDSYDCVFDILKPKTWFGCSAKFIKSEVLKIHPHMFFKVSQNGRSVPIRSFNTKRDNFTLLAGYVRNTEDFKLSHTYRIINGDYDIFYDHKTDIPLNPEVITEKSSQGNSPRAFRFPFNKLIGVTQWYGETEFQSPHTGIDFGATKEKVASVGDGEVVGKGWDSYYGECLSGGNFIKVKHPNGMHTTYFHLEDIYVNTGDLVRRGQVIAKSGNTGFWNCQKLDYHLHFETRLNANYKSHTNPVPYIAVDWNKIPTLGAKYNPGRLSGENPHPGM